MKNTTKPIKPNLGIFRVIIVALILVGTYLTSHYNRRFKGQEVEIKAQELINKNRDSMLKIIERMPKGKPLRSKDTTTQETQDSLRRLYDTNDTEYDPSLLIDDEWDGYYN